MKSVRYYMVSSIIMDGAEDLLTIDTARKVAKKEAVRLARDKKYGHAGAWVTIDKYNLRTKTNTLLESWQYRDGKYVCEKEPRSG